MLLKFKVSTAMKKIPSRIAVVITIDGSRKML